MITAVRELPNVKAIDFENGIKKCLGADYKGGPPKDCIDTMKAMMKSIASPLSKANELNGFWNQIENLLTITVPDNSIIAGFVAQVLQRTIRNPEAHNNPYRICMLDRLKSIYQNNVDADVISHKAATELQNVLYDLRDESVETARADLF